HTDTRVYAGSARAGGDEGDAGHMRARGAPTDVQPVRVGTERGGIIVSPGNRSSHLRGHDAQIAIRLFDPDVIDDDEICAGVDEHFGGIAMISRFAAEPCTAVNEQENRRAWFLCSINVRV